MKDSTCSVNCAPQMKIGRYSRQKLFVQQQNSTSLLKGQ